MSKLEAIVAEVFSKLEDLPKEKRDAIDKTIATLSPAEYVAMMDAQAQMFASGMISQYDAMFLYNTIKDWDSAPLASRIVTLRIVEEYAKRRGAKQRTVTKRKPTTKKKTTQKNRR